MRNMKVVLIVVGVAVALTIVAAAGLSAIEGMAIRILREGLGR